MKRVCEYNQDSSLKLIHLESHGIPFRPDHNYSYDGELIDGSSSKILRGIYV